MLKRDIKILKSVSEEKRFNIIRMLMKDRKGIFVNNIRKKLKIEATLLSHHLYILKSAGLITSTKFGKKVQYNLNPKCKNVEGTSIVTPSFILRIL